MHAVPERVDGGEDSPGPDAAAGNPVDITLVGSPFSRSHGPLEASSHTRSNTDLILQGDEAELEERQGGTVNTKHRRIVLSKTVPSTSTSFIPNTPVTPRPRIHVLHRSQCTKALLDVDHLPRQLEVRNAYSTSLSQIIVAVLIFTNFVISAVHAQVLPPPDSPASNIFFIFEVLFAVIFTLELLLNFYGHFAMRFLRSPWNWFDSIVVIVSLLSLMLKDLPGISALRLFRAFRVFRLFNRVESLRAIIEGVFKSLPGVCNAFMILGVLMGIWSIIAVENLRDAMPQHFGSFAKAMFTMFQLLTMDSWASGITRNIIFGYDWPLAPVFFISYMFVAGIVMTNVVVAILLERYLTSTRELGKKEEELAQSRASFNDTCTPSPSATRQSDLKHVSLDNIYDLLKTCTSEANLSQCSRPHLLSLATTLYRYEAMRRSMQRQYEIRRDVRCISKNKLAKTK